MSSYNYLKALSCNVLTLTLSIKISPDVISVNLKREAKIELFPDPVLPTIPIFSAGLVLNDTPFREGTKCSLKRKNKKQMLVKQMLVKLTTSFC